jgi:hypothetical protein
LELNVVFFGFSQALIGLLAAMTLSIGLVLLWKNHRAFSSGSMTPSVILQRIGALCPFEPISGPSLAVPVLMPARAPPTFASPVKCNFEQRGLIVGRRAAVVSMPR